MTADLAIVNAKVYTVDPARPWAEAVACRAGRVVVVGAEADVRGLIGPATRVVDAGGRLVLPGLTDAHVHFLAYAVRRRQVSLFGLTDFGAVRARLVEAAAAAGPDEWILGWGWDSNRWDTPPTAALLDAIAPRQPVVLARMDMHTWWVNSLVLDIAGVTAETPDPPDSAIARDANGRPTGLFSEWNAIALIERYVPRPDAAVLAGWLAETVAEANRLGLTGIHDQRVEREGAESLRLFQALRREGRLSLRVHANIAADYLAEAAQLGLHAGFGDDTLWLGHAKAFADGAMGSRTALLLAAYDGEPDNTGIVVTPPDRLWSHIVAAGEAGFPMSVHAIGDRAVREVLDVMGEWHGARAAVAALPMPQRIEHLQLMHPDDLGRVAAYNVVGSVQPVHLLSDWRTADRVWGSRARHAYAFRALLDRGATLAFGSDAPVAPLNPMLGVHAAVTRQDETGEPAGGWYPQERLSVAEAIAGYTRGPAVLSGKADRLGKIAPGGYADLVVLSQDLFAIPPEAIPATTAWMTIFDGRVIYES